MNITSFNFSKTSPNALSINPFVVRPGTVVTVVIEYLDSLNQIDYDTQIVTSVSAIDSTSSSYYKDYFIDENNDYIPMTIVPLTLPTNQRDYTLEDFTLTADIKDNGICLVDKDTWRITNSGVISFINKAILRNGYIEAEVPMDSDMKEIRFAKTSQGQNRRKVVEIDDQTPSVNIEAMGMAQIRDNVYILTNYGLYSYDKKSDFSTPVGYYAYVLGRDIMYLPTNQLGVISSDGTRVDIYDIKSDYIYMDRDLNEIYYRHLDTHFSMS